MPHAAPLVLLFHKDLPESSRSLFPSPAVLPHTVMLVGSCRHSGAALAVPDNTKGSASSQPPPDFCHEAQYNLPRNGALLHRLLDLQTGVP